MHNDYPWRKVFALFKSCPGFVGVFRGGGGRLDEIDTCIMLSSCKVRHS